MVVSATKRPSDNARRRGRSRRSRREWAVRSALALLVAVAGYAAVTFSMGQVIAKTDPALAHLLVPYDGRITARLAAELSRPEAGAEDRRQGDIVAKLALRQDPTAVAAVSALGVNAQVRGDDAATRRLFAYADKLSRRDTIAQLWAIEDSVARGDIRGAVRHYDIALRVRPELSELLYPILASASAEPAVRAELTRTLASKPAWADSFIEHVATHGPNPAATVAFMTGLQKAGVVVPATARAGLVNTLLAGNLLEQAWGYYAQIRAGADRGRSRDPDFAARIEVRTPFDWMATGDMGATGVIDGGVFDFSAPASVGGPLLQQLELLPAGSYRLSGRSDGIDQADDARPYWTLTCRGDSRELGRVTMPNSDKNGGSFTGTLIVPAGCPAQLLTLVARPSDAVSGVSGRIDRAELIPAR